MVDPPASPRCPRSSPPPWPPRGPSSRSSACSQTPDRCSAMPVPSGGNPSTPPPSAPMGKRRGGRLPTPPPGRSCPGGGWETVRGPVWAPLLSKSQKHGGFRAVTCHILPVSHSFSEGWCISGRLCQERRSLCFWTWTQGHEVLRVFVCFSVSLFYRHQCWSQ